MNANTLERLKRFLDLLLLGITHQMFKISKEKVHIYID